MKLVMNTLWVLLIKKHQELKGSIRMMNIQRSDVEKNNFIGEGKKVGINNVVKQNEIINNKIRP